MASRSATVLIIFVIAIVAFCLASVCASMTGTISILPNGTGNDHTILDNLSAITDSSDDSNKISGYKGHDYSSSSSSNVETTTDDSSSSSSDNTQPSDEGQDSDSQDSSDTPTPSPSPSPSPTPNSNVVTYTG